MLKHRESSADASLALGQSGDERSALFLQIRQHERAIGEIKQRLNSLVLIGRLPAELLALVCNGRLMLALAWHKDNQYLTPKGNPRHVLELEVGVITLREGGRVDPPRPVLEYIGGWLKARQGKQGLYYVEDAGRRAVQPGASQGGFYRDGGLHVKQRYTTFQDHGSAHGTHSWIRLRSGLPLGRILSSQCHT